MLLAAAFLVQCLSLVIASSYTRYTTEAVPIGDCNCASPSAMREIDELLRYTVTNGVTKIKNSIDLLKNITLEETRNSLEWSEYSVVKELREIHECFLYHDSDILKAVKNLYISIITAIREGHKLSSESLWSSFLTKQISMMWTTAFPTTFVCLATQRYPTHKDHAYNRCIKKHDEDLYFQLFDTQQFRVSHEVAGACFRLHSFFQALDALEKATSASEKEQFRNSCVRRLAEIIKCPDSCTKGHGYCKESCHNAVQNCFDNLSSDLNAQILMVLQYRDILNEFLKPLETAITESFINAAEKRIELVAYEIVSRCGQHKISDLPLGHFATKTIIIQTPRRMRQSIADTVKKFSQQLDFWNDEGDKLCTNPALTSRCWNGIRVIERLFTPKTAKTYDCQSK